MSLPATIGRIEVVKSLSGGMGHKSGFTDERYNQIIQSWDGRITSATRKFDWQESDPDYNAVRGIIEQFAAASILWMVDKHSTSAQAFWKSASEDFKALMETSAVVGQPASGGQNVPMAHQSFPANVNGSYYTGLKKRYPLANTFIDSQLGVFYPDRF